MTYIQCTPTQPQLIAVSRLTKSPLNARRTVAKIGIDELKASLLAHGLMQNLVVTDSGDGSYLVIAGGRRLEAIHTLQAEGKLPEDFAVPCQIVSEEQASEMSLAENTVRLAMHPADQFEAFVSLIDQGQNASQVAERFGIEESLVLKRMKLARVAPELLDVYRQDGMTLECLMAFTVTDDHRRQRKVFKSLQDWQKEDPSEIRAALTEKMVEADSKLARFVGLDAYTAAGGSSRADLFGEAVYLEKPALLNKLAEKKLDGIRSELEAEGWGWIEINPERDYTLVNRCSRIKPMLVEAPSELLDFKTRLDSELKEIENAMEDSESEALIEQQQAVRDRMDEVEEKLLAFVGYHVDHKALAGCFVSIGQDGTPFIDKGLVKPEQRKQLAQLLKSEDDAGGHIPTKRKGDLPESLRRDLADQRLQIAQVEIAKHPQVAFDLLVFQVTSSLIGETYPHKAADIEFRYPRLKPTHGTPKSKAANEFDSMAKSLPLDWLTLETSVARFEAFRSLPNAVKLELLAYCVALTLKPKLGTLEGEEATAYDAALSLTGSEVAGYWRPTKDNFLSRINREQLLAISSEVLGETWAQAGRNEKKSVLVVQLDRAFSNPDGYAPEQIAKLKSWLPKGMAFDIAASPKPAKTKKARKAAR